jgi:DNA-binding transcriptional regulator YiaG
VRTAPVSWAVYIEGMTGDEFRARREALSLSRRELADALGVAYRTVQDWELGASSRLLSPGGLVELALAELERRLARVPPK